MKNIFLLSFFCGFISSSSVVDSGKEQSVVSAEDIKATGMKSHKSIRRPEDVRMDFLSHPKYRIQILSEPLHSRDSSLSLNDDEKSTVDVVRLVAADKSKYYCRIPTPQEIEKEITTSDKKKEELVEPTVEYVFEKLKKWKEKCITTSIGWWMYDFCHLSYVKQYHQKKPTIPPEVEFYLGHFTSTHYRETAKIQDNEEAKYLSLRIGGGTVCDITGKPREVEIQYQCAPSHREINRLASVKEVSTCNYVIVVYLKDMCSIPGFNRPHALTPNLINCTKILDDTEWSQYQEELKSRPKLKKANGQQPQQKSTFKIQKIQSGQIFDAETLAAAAAAGGDGNGLVENAFSVLLESLLNDVETLNSRVKNAEETQDDNLKEQQQQQQQEYGEEDEDMENTGVKLEL